MTSLEKVMEREEWRRLNEIDRERIKVAIEFVRTGCGGSVSPLEHALGSINDLNKFHWAVTQAFAERLTSTEPDLALEVSRAIRVYEGDDDSKGLRNMKAMEIKELKSRSQNEASRYIAGYSRKTKTLSIHYNERTDLELRPVQFSDGRTEDATELVVKLKGYQLPEDYEKIKSLLWHSMELILENERDWDDIKLKNETYNGSKGRARDVEFEKVDSENLLDAIVNVNKWYRLKIDSSDLNIYLQKVGDNGHATYDIIITTYAKDRDTIINYVRRMNALIEMHMKDSRDIGRTDSSGLW